MTLSSGQKRGPTDRCECLLWVGLQPLEKISNRFPLLSLGQLSFWGFCVARFIAVRIATTSSESAGARLPVFLDVARKYTRNAKGR